MKLEMSPEHWLIVGVCLLGFAFALAAVAWRLGRRAGLRELREERGEGEGMER